jgi:Leucine-rich repeat (LRR) protein
LDKDIFRNSTNLAYLYLNYNALQTLDATIFSNNKKLITISLYGNKINAVSSKMFQSFYNTSLALDLRSNPCIDQYFGIGFLLNVAQQRALESFLFFFILFYLVLKGLMSNGVSSGDLQ